MKSVKVFLALLLSLLLIGLVAIPAAAGGPNLASLNARMIQWQERDNVIHIIVQEDDGRSIVGPAYVPDGKPLLFGFEWFGGDDFTLEELNAAYIDDPGHDITLEISGDLVVPEHSLKSFYQEAHEATPGRGAPWLWDHDHDGLGDRDGDGIGDLYGSVLFFRYPYPGLSAGTYYFTFTLYDGFAPFYSDTITVIVP